MFLERGKNLVATCTISLKHNRHIGIIVTDIRVLRAETDSRHTGKSLAVMLCKCLSFCNLPVNMAQIAQSHRCLKFVHFAICSDVLDALISGNSEILELIEAIL